MRRTKSNYIKVMEEMRSNLMSIANMYKKRGDDISYRKQIKEVIGLNTALSLLKDKEYFDKMCELYNVE